VNISSAERVASFSSYSMGLSTGYRDRSMPVIPDVVEINPWKLE
jgi:hypothetical protein